MAIVGYFVGPMFNMLVWLGTAFVVRTSKFYPNAYVTPFPCGTFDSIYLPFIEFDRVSTSDYLIQIPGPRFWCLSCSSVYSFMTINLVIAKFWVIFLNY